MNLNEPWKTWHHPQATPGPAPTPIIPQDVLEMMKHLPPRDAQQMAKHYLDIAMHPPVMVSSGGPKRQVEIRDAYTPWKQDMPETYDTMRQNLTPLGALCMRLRAKRGMSLHSGDVLPGIRHISAYVVEERNERDFHPETPTAAYVFVVNDKGEALTFEDPTPSLFPSDTLVLQIGMVMDSAQEVDMGPMTATGIQKAMQQAQAKAAGSLLGSPANSLGAYP